MLAYNSPLLIAVNHVLLRLSMPRHSLCALLCFTICSFGSSQNFRVQLFVVFFTQHFGYSPSCRCFYLLVVFTCICFHYSVFKLHFFSVLFQEQISTDDLFHLLIFALASKTLLSHTIIFFQKPSCKFKAFSLVNPNCFSFAYFSFFTKKKSEWWAQMDSNHRPHAYQACALTT